MNKIFPIIYQFDKTCEESIPKLCPAWHNLWTRCYIKNNKLFIYTYICIKNVRLGCFSIFFYKFKRPSELFGTLQLNKNPQFIKYLFNKSFILLTFLHIIIYIAFIYYWNDYFSITFLNTFAISNPRVCVIGSLLTIHHLILHDQHNVSLLSLSVLVLRSLYDEHINQIGKFKILSMERNISLLCFFQRDVSLLQKENKRLNILK